MVEDLAESFQHLLRDYSRYCAFVIWRSMPVGDLACVGLASIGRLELVEANYTKLIFV